MRLVLFLLDVCMLVKRAKHNKRFFLGLTRVEENINTR